MNVNSLQTTNVNYLWIHLSNVLIFAYFSGIAISQESWYKVLVPPAQIPARACAVNWRQKRCKHRTWPRLVITCITPKKPMMWHDSQLSISKNKYSFVFLWLGQAQLQNSIAASRELTWIGGYNIPGHPGWVLKGCDQLSQSRRLSIKKLSLKAVKAMDTTLPLRRCRAQLKTKLSSPWCVDPVARWWALKQQALRRILYHFDDQENRMIWTSVFNEAWGTKEHSSEVNTGLTMYPPPPALRNLGLVFDPFFLISDLDSEFGNIVNHIAYIPGIVWFAKWWMQWWQLHASFSVNLPHNCLFCPKEKSSGIA